LEKINAAVSAAVMINTVIVILRFMFYLYGYAKARR
jgi:hypothetical protein